MFRARNGVAAVLLAVMAGLAWAIPAEGDGAPPALVSQHHLIGDPLFDMSGSNGNLLSNKPDEHTSIASSTKIWTLHLVTWAIDAGWVSLTDLVTVDAFAASIEPGNSVMADINGVTLQPGEIVMLDDLVRGMMYPSGNDAAWAIAAYVARQIWGLPADGDEFVNLMNFHAQVEGFTDSWFTSPNGWDDGPANDPIHFTTARELARMWHHAAESHPYFLQVTGFVGTWTATTTGAPGGPKIYQFGFPFFSGPAPIGWEGGKGGGTTQCNGPNSGCMIASASRMGRRLVVSFMQGQPWAQEPGMFTYGFSKLFHPDAHGESAPWGSIRDHAVVCSGTNRAVTAMITPNQALRLATWDVDMDASTVSHVASNEARFAPGRAQSVGQGPPVDVDLIRLEDGHYVAGKMIGNSVHLSPWSVSGAGVPTSAGAPKPVGAGESIDLEAVGPKVFVSAVIENGQVVLDSWHLVPALQPKLNPKPAFVIAHLDSTTYNPGSDVLEVDLATARVSTLRLLGLETKRFLILDAALADGTTRVLSWSLDDLGAFTFHDGASGGSGTAVSITSYDGVVGGGTFFTGAPGYIVIAKRNPSGNLALRYFTVDSDGMITTAGNVADSGIPLGSLTTTTIVRAGQDGVLVMTNSPVLGQRLFVWETRASGAGASPAAPIAEHLATFGTNLDSCPLDTSHAEADLVTSLRDANGKLRLRAWRVGDRP